MKLLFRTWLAAALLLATASFAAPATGALALRVESCITCVDGARRSQCEISEPRTPSVSDRYSFLPTLVQDETSAASFPLDRSLFQRPPPALPRS